MCNTCGCKSAEELKAETFEVFYRLQTKDGRTWLNIGDFKKREEAVEAFNQNIGKSYELRLVEFETMSEYGAPLETVDRLIMSYNRHGNKIQVYESETFEAKGYKGISASKIQVLEKYIENGGKALDYHELPYHIQRQLEMGKVHELLYQDVNRWLQDNAPNPHHAMPSWLSAETFEADEKQGICDTCGRKRWWFENKRGEISGQVCGYGYTLEKAKKAHETGIPADFCRGVVNNPFTKNAETFEARENKDGTIVLSDAEFRGTKLLHNGNYLWYYDELKYIDRSGLKHGNKFEKVRSYNDVEMPLVRKYEKALKDQEYKMRMRFRKQLEDYGIRSGRNRVNDKTVYHRSEGFEAETFEAKGYRNPYAFRKPKLVDTDKYKGHSEGHKNGSWDLYEMYGSNDKLQLEIRPLHDKWGITIPITSVGVKDAQLIADAPMLLEEVKDGNRIKEYIYSRLQYPSIKKIHLDDLIAFIEEDDERFEAEDESLESLTSIVSKNIPDYEGLSHEQVIELIKEEGFTDLAQDELYAWRESIAIGDEVGIRNLKSLMMLRKKVSELYPENFEASGIDTFTEPFTEMKTGSILKKAILLGSLGVGAFVGNKLRK